jgi:two-component sensor histidine kinase
MTSRIPSSVTAATVTLDKVFITAELENRVAPESNDRHIKQAIQELAAQILEGPDKVLPLFVALAMEIGGGVSAGISILELDANPPIFRWAFLKGSLAVFEGATIPRDLSPCGVTLDQDKPVLTRHPERYYSWIADVNVVAPEVLLVPLHRGSEQLGTLWLLSDTVGHFNRGHVAAITDIAAFVSVALGMHLRDTRMSKALIEQESIAKEMSHRVKNVFTIVDSLIYLSARNAETKDELAETLSGRVHALAVAHGIIRRTNTDTTTSLHATELGDLVRAILRPYEAAENQPSRVIDSWPQVALGERATSGVALVLHELATNAAKYGALSRDDGVVEVTWTVEKTDLCLKWKERGGPLVSGLPSRAGFGTRLVTDTVEKTLSGTQRYEWHPEGVEITLRLPLERLKA